MTTPTVPATPWQTSSLASVSIGVACRLSRMPRQKSISAGRGSG